MTTSKWTSLVQLIQEKAQKDLEKKALWKSRCIISEIPVLSLAIALREALLRGPEALGVESFSDIIPQLVKATAGQADIHDAVLGAVETVCKEAIDSILRWIDNSLVSYVILLVPIPLDPSPRSEGPLAKEEKRPIQIESRHETEVHLLVVEVGASALRSAKSVCLQTIKTQAMKAALPPPLVVRSLKK